jgi:uncharacterized protein (DUF488 family)
MTGDRPTTIWTVGHSARTEADFMALLRAQAIECVADVRRFPRSRRYPHFDGQRLSTSLVAIGVRYEHLVALGGMRDPDGSFTNAGLRAGAFRAYADYMQTVEFNSQLAALLAIARERRTAIMCAEAVPEDCHRSLIADALVARKVAVEHILGVDETRRHALRSTARVDGTRVTYPAAQTELGIKPAWQ